MTALNPERAPCGCACWIQSDELHFRPCSPEHEEVGLETFGIELPDLPIFDVWDGTN